MSRRILEARIPDAPEPLIGTAHDPDGEPIAPGLALVFFNFGQAPRSGHGDIAALSADACARAGIPVYRFDFPGLGDSVGDLEPREDRYWRFVEKGGHLRPGIGILEHLEQHEGVTQFLLGGLCGGGVTSIYVAEKWSEKVRGLALLEPSFLDVRVAGESQASNAELTSKQVHHALRDVPKRLLSPRSWARLFTGKSRYRGHFGLVKTLMMRLGRRVGGKGKLPADTNRELVAAFRACTKRGLPVLMLTAGSGPLHEQILRVLEDSLDAKRRACVQLLPLEHTNHTFGVGNAKPKSIDSVTAWAVQQANRR